MCIAKLQQLNQSLMGQTQGQQEEEVLNQQMSRESFEDNALQAKELQIKRQYIERLREKFTNLVEENSYLKGELGGAPEPIE